MYVKVRTMYMDMVNNVHGPDLDIARGRGRDICEILRGTKFEMRLCAPHFFAHKKTKRK
jgi:hypothetical protein